MHFLIYLLVSVVLVLLPLCASATTYYVRPGGGGATCSTNPASAGGSIQAAASNCLGPGDRLEIRGGTYDESLRGPWPSGTNFGAGAITITAFAGETVRIKPSSDTLVVLITDAAYLIFDRLIFDGSVMNGSPVLRPDVGSHHIRFQDGVLIGRVGSNGLQTGINDGVEPRQGARAIEIVRMDICCNGSYALYIETDSNLVDGNYIHDNGGYAMHIYHSNFDQDVHHNIVRNNVLARNTYGIGGEVADYGGIIIIGHDNQVYNNLIYEHGVTATLGGIILRYSGGNNYILNNTIANNPYTHTCIHADTGSASSDRIQNNICWGNGNNSIVDAGGNGTISTNLTTQDPRFVDPPNGNYRLQTTSMRSPALDAADNLTSLGVFTGDITTPTTGLVRPTPPNPWDQGAYEMEAGGVGPTSPPSKGTFFIAPGGTTTTDCDAAKGAVGSPSASPFGTYATARVCMLAGSTLYFRAGTYPPLDTNVTPFSGGSPSDGPTTLAAYPGETVTLQATGGSPVVFLHNSTTDHFIILQGLILDGLNINGTNGFAGYPGINDIRLDNVEIKNTYYEGVFLQQTSNVELRNNTRVHNSALASVGVVGLDRTTNTTITGSEVYASGGPGISSYGGNTNLLIEKSTIRNTPSGKGIILGNGSNPDSGVQIANSLIYTNTHGIHLQNGTTGAKLYYNTLWNNSVACMLFDSGVTVSEAINNVCWQVANVTNNAGSGMVLTTNQCTGPTGCTAGDPLFASVTPGDANFLHLCGAASVPAAGCTGKSPAVDTGTPIPSLTSDYASKARPDGVQVDRGAFEEAPVPVPPAQVGLAPVYRTTHFLTLLP